MTSPIKTIQTNEPNWFLLYGGESADGMGSGTYAGRTKSVIEALAFYNQFIKNNPYSTGRVVMINDTQYEHADEANLIRLKNLSLKNNKQGPKIPSSESKPLPPGYGGFA